MFGGCLVLMSAVQAINALVSLPQRAGQWRALRRERAAQSALRESLTEYFSARFGRSRKAAQRALAIAQDTPVLQADPEFRLLGYLLAAGSLHRLQDRPRRDETLRLAILAALAKRPGPRSGDEAARMLAAEWALDDRDAARALEALEALPAGAARRTHALRLKLQALRMARRPLEALHTARLLANHQAFSPLVAQSLLRSLVGEALEGTHDVQQLRRLWNQFDSADRRDAQVAARAALRAVQLQSPEDARAWLRPFWDRLSAVAREDREQVALALIEARTGIGVDWLPRLEAAAQAFGHEGAVVAAVGMAYAERQLWGKARKLLEQAAAAPGLPARARRAAWRQLATLARHEADDVRAAQCDQAAAALD
jgi:HemY protein